MNAQEQKLKKKVQVIVATCLTLFFILVTIVVFQFAIRINQDGQERALKRQNDSLSQQINRAKYETEYFKTPEFQEDYALRYLNKGQQGDIIFD